MTSVTTRYVQEGEQRDSDERDEGHDCAVSASATLRAFPGFLDQRLDESLDLLAFEGFAAAGWAGRSGDGHNYLRSPIELVLLSP